MHEIHLNSVKKDRFFRLENIQTSTDGHSASHSTSTMGSFWGQSVRGFRMTTYQ